MIAATADGTFLVVWQEGGETSGAPIRAQLFNADGTKSGGVLTLGSATAPDDTDPRISVTNDGRFLVVWEDDTRNLVPSGNDEIHGVFVDPRDKGVTFNGKSLGEQFVGTDFNDVLRGNGGTDKMLGGKGNDRMFGNGGADKLYANDGADVVEGGGGGDTLDGGGGKNDTLSYVSSLGAVTVDLSANSASGGDANGDDYAGFENVTGSAGNDLLSGDLQNNVLRGGLGADTLSGRGGNDTIEGGGMDDIISGGAGRDKLTGGSEADTFVYAAVTDSGPGAGADLITDFAVNVDTIRLTQIDAIKGGTDDAFAFIGNAAAFTGVGQVRFEQDIGNNRTTVFINLDSDAAAEMEIRFTGLINFTGTDFDL